MLQNKTSGEFSKKELSYMQRVYSNLQAFHSNIQKTLGVRFILKFAINLGTKVLNFGLAVFIN